MLWDARDKVFDFDYKHLCRQDPDKYICMSIRYPVLFYFHQDSHNNNIDPSCRIHACKAYWADNLHPVLLVNLFAMYHQLHDIDFDSFAKDILC